MSVTAAMQPCPMPAERIENPLMKIICAGMENHPGTICCLWLCGLKFCNGFAMGIRCHKTTCLIDLRLL